jgi:hypothetical protein
VHQGASAGEVPPDKQAAARALPVFLAAVLAASGTRHNAHESVRLPFGQPTHSYGTLDFLLVRTAVRSKATF